MRTCTNYRVRLCCAQNRSNTLSFECVRANGQIRTWAQSVSESPTTIANQPPDVISVSTLFTHRYVYKTQRTVRLQSGPTRRSCLCRKRADTDWSGTRVAIHVHCSCVCILYMQLHGVAAAVAAIRVIAMHNACVFLSPPVLSPGRLIVQ